MMEKMEFGNGLEGPVLHGIYFSKEEISVLRDSLESYDKSLCRTIDRWSNPVFNMGEGLINKKDLNAYKERSLKALHPEVEKREIIKKLLAKV
tara:strand:+ start:440 stop:718 length:279 start_codon:yes stop_codon:yes gene_type:complete